MAADLLQELGREEVIEDGGLLRQHGQLLVGPAGQAVARHLHLPRVQPQVCRAAGHVLEHEGSELGQHEIVGNGGAALLAHMLSMWSIGDAVAHLLHLLLI